MFFFASDNTLSPSTLSQVKAIKAAGFQIDTNVVVYFDPNERGAPTRVFEINKNQKEKQTQSRIGDCSGPLVSVLTPDNISPQTISELPGEESIEFGKSLKNIDALNATTALNDFLGFCRETYPAEHYMLFLVGHGLVVGRDAFLPDENPDSAIGLIEFGETIKRFSDQIKKHDGVLDLIAMHSCSMSAIEVAYQLKDTASYMLSSQGISFVASWPYRQMLIEIFTAIEAERAVNTTDGRTVNVDLLKRLHTLCIQNSADFIYAGYSADISLCSLGSQQVKKLDEPISNLSNALIAGLRDARCRELILLAHWRSQSYWQETYTDLYDFCLCLRRLCEPKHQHPGEKQQGEKPQFGRRQSDQTLKDIATACTAVIEKLTPSRSTPPEGLVVFADFIGPDTQYSHGLSIYFPWSEPMEDQNEHVLRNYGNYAFTRELFKGPWLDFLRSYFLETRRKDRLTDDADRDFAYLRDPLFLKALETARATFTPENGSGGGTVITPTRQDVIADTILEGKVSPPDAGGAACYCLSIKNYSREFTMSPGASAIFMEEETKPDIGSKAA